MTVDEIDLEWNTRIEMYLHFSVLCHFSSCSQQFKTIDEISYEKKNWTQEYPREKIMVPRNTHEEKVCVTNDGIQPTKFSTLIYSLIEAAEEFVACVKS